MWKSGVFDCMRVSILGGMPDAKGDFLSVCLRYLRALIGAGSMCTVSKLACQLGYLPHSCPYLHAYLGTYLAN